MPTKSPSRVKADLRSRIFEATGAPLTSQGREWTRPLVIRSHQDLRKDWSWWWGVATDGEWPQVVSGYCEDPTVMDALSQAIDHARTVTIRDRGDGSWLAIGCEETDATTTHREAHS